MSPSYSLEEENIIISMVGDNEIIWNTKHPEYFKKSDKKQQIFSQIAEVLSGSQNGEVVPCKYDVGLL